MIGRERQLRTLLDAFEGVVADRTCHLFTVLGPPGIGKSRLVREFGSRIDAGGAAPDRPVPVLRGGHHALADRPRWRSRPRHQGRRPPEHAEGALRAALGDAPDADAIAAQLGDLLGIGGGGGRSRRPGRSGASSRRSRGERPVVAVLDDIHWAEPTLLDVIEHVADWSRDAPILLLCMARPELLEERPGLGRRQAERDERAPRAARRSARRTS